MPQQSETHRPLAAVAIPALKASSETQTTVELTRQQQLIEPPTSSPQPSALPILGRLETSTRLLADFFQGEVIDSSEAAAIANSGELEAIAEAPIEPIQPP